MISAEEATCAKVEMTKVAYQPLLSEIPLAFRPAEFVEPPQQSPLLVDADVVGSFRYYFLTVRARLTLAQLAHLRSPARLAFASADVPAAARKCQRQEPPTQLAELVACLRAARAAGWGMPSAGPRLWPWPGLPSPPSPFLVTSGEPGRGPRPNSQARDPGAYGPVINSQGRDPSTRAHPQPLSHLALWAILPCVAVPWSGASPSFFLALEAGGGDRDTADPPIGGYTVPLCLRAASRLVACWRSAAVLSLWDALAFAPSSVGA